MLFCREENQEAMDADDEMSFIDVPEQPREDLVITVPVPEERSSDEPQTWAERVANDDNPSHTDARARPAYPAHLLSEVNAFDGVLPSSRLGELSHNEQLRLFRLNGVPNRPCSARFTLSDNSIDSRTLLDQIVATGVPRPHVRCIQRFRSGQVDVTFTRSDLRDLFLSKASIMIRQRPAYPRPAWQSGTFVTVRDAPWELPDELIVQRLGEYGEVHSWRRAYNQSLLPEKVHDGRRVLRMTVQRDIPSFMKFGPYLVRVFYPEQPRVCWKCASPDHIGKDCPEFYCFNCDQPGHTARFCEEHIKCSLCKSEDHLAIDCPGNWGRRTMAQRTPERTEEPAEEPADESTPQDLDHLDDDLESLGGSTATNDTAEDDPGTDQEESLPSDEHSEDTAHEEDSVSESIEQFTSSEENVDPPLPQRKRGGNIVAHVKKKSRFEENPP